MPLGDHPLHRSPISIERLLAVLTISRLIFVPIIIEVFMVSPAITAIALLLFIATDVFDGVLARRHEADGPSRRALDSIVDRLAIDACLIGAWFSGVMPLPILCALLARDIYLAVLCHQMLRKRRVAIKADWLYRTLNLGIATWALIIPFVSADLRVMLAFLLLGLSILVAGDLTRSVRMVLKAPPDVRNTVIGAGWLRRDPFECHPRAQHRRWQLS